MTLVWNPGSRRKRRWRGSSTGGATVSGQPTKQQLAEQQAENERARYDAAGELGVVLPDYTLSPAGALTGGSELTRKTMEADRAVMEAELKKRFPDRILVQQIQERLTQYENDVRVTTRYLKEEQAQAKYRELTKQRSIMQRLADAGAIDADGRIDLVKAGASGITDAEIAQLGITPPAGAPSHATPIGLAREADVRRRQAESQQSVVNKLEASGVVTEGKVDLQAAMAAGITADELATIGISVPENLQPARPTTQGQPQARVPKTTTNVLVRLYPEAFGDVGSAEDIDAMAAMLLRQLATLIDSDAVGFLQDLMDRGQTTETMELLALLGATPQDIQEIMGAADAQDAMDALISAALPGQNAETVQELLNTDEEAFVELITAGGRNDQKEELLAAMGMSQEEIDGLFPSARRFGGHAVDEDLEKAMADALKKSALSDEEVVQIAQQLQAKRRAGKEGFAGRPPVGPKTRILPEGTPPPDITPDFFPETVWNAYNNWIAQPAAGIFTFIVQGLSRDQTFMNEYAKVIEESKTRPQDMKANLLTALGEAYQRTQMPLILRLATDIISDPTNLIPGIGIVNYGSKAIKGARVVTKGVKVGGTIERAAAKTLDDLATMGTRPAGQAVTEGGQAEARAVAGVPKVAKETTEAVPIPKAKVTPAVTTPTKEPWQMTWEEYSVRPGVDVSPYGGEAPHVAEAHYTSIKQALSQGKPVPPEVLREYPDLAKGVKPGPSESAAAKGALPAVPAGQARTASEVKAIQEAAKAAPEKVAPEKATLAHVESAAPDGPKPPKPPETVAKAEDPDDIAREIAELATGGEKPNETLLRRHEAAVGNEQRRVGIVIKEGNARLKSLGVGITRLGQLVPTEADIPKLDELFNVLHNPSKVASGEIKVPAGFEDVYAQLRELTDWEQAARLDFDPQMATVQDYFYRGWKPPEGAFANVSQGKPLVRTPAFKKLRAEATYAEMREAGFEPLFWNPYQQWGISRMQGIKYREQMALVEKLKGMGEDFARPHAGGPVPDGWRVPEVGPAFEGKPFATTDGTGEPMVMYTRRWITPDSVANTLENIYGKRPNIGKVVVGGKVVDPLKVVDWLTFLPKRAKLFGSFFQQIDFLTRAGAGAWTMMVDSLLAGKPVDAVMALARLPKTAITMIESNFSPGLRMSLAKQLESTAPLVKGRPGLTMKSITEAGLSTIDPAMLNWSEMDKIISVVKEEAKLAGKLKRVPGAILELESMMRRGLFEGVYPAALIADITNNMAPIAARLYPNLNDAQLSGLIARMANKAYSTIPASQSVIQNRAIRETLRRIFFSVGESEGLLRQATGAIRGPEARYWRRRWIGAYLSLIATANVIHFASTGKPLPAERYTPVSKDKWGPLPFGYNTRFAAPAIPLKGRGGSELTLDIVGQMDTVFRVLNPGFFITSRESVPIRALVNQVSGTDFFGKPIDDVGPGGIISRLTQLAQDMGAPIGLGGLGTEAIRRYIPGAAKVVTEGEARLGVPGLAIQATGVNVRAETREMRLKRLYGAEAQDTIGKLGQLGQELGIVPRRLDIDIGIKGGEIELTSEQRDQLQWLTDDIMVQGLQKLFADAEFNALSNSAKQDALSKRMTELRSEARNEFRGNLTEARNLLATTLREADDQLGRTIGEVKPFSHEALDIYDTGGDLDSFYRKKLSNVPREALVGLTLPPTVQSWYDKEEARKVAGELGGQKLYTINADESKGDTFEDYYNQWQNDKTKGDPKGNISRRELDLLKKFHSLDKEGQAQFLKDNPELARVPQDEWLKSHPKENAVLAIWGEGKLLTQEAYDEAKRLIKELDIPDKALPKFTLPPDKSVKAYFEYQDAVKRYGGGSIQVDLILKKNVEFQKWRGLQDPETPLAALELKVQWDDVETEFKALKDKDDTVKDADGLTQRDRALAELKKDNPGWWDDQRRIEAYAKGADKATADLWAERGAKADESSGFDTEEKLWYVDHPQVYKWALEKELVKSDSTRWNVPKMRLDVQYRDEDAEFEAIDAKAKNPETGILLRDEYLAEHDNYRQDKRRGEAWELVFGNEHMIPDVDTFVEEYMGYYEEPQYGASRDRWRAKYGGFDQVMVALKKFAGLVEPTKIPAVQYDQIYEDWKPQFDAYDNVQGTESLRAAQRESMLVNDPEFRQAFYQRQAYKKLVPEQYVKDYADYYSRVKYMKPANWEESTGQDLWYEDDWFMMEHRDFYMNVWKDQFGNKASDFSTVPTRIVFNKWLKYQTLTRSAQINFRFNHRDLDAWGVLKHGWKPISRLDR